MPILLSLEGDAGIHLNAFDQITIIHPPLDPNIIQPAHGTNERVNLYPYV